MGGPSLWLALSMAALLLLMRTNKHNETTERPKLCCSTASDELCSMFQAS